MNAPLASEQVVVQSPLSITGSFKRCQHWYRSQAHPAARVAVVLVAILYVSFATLWTVLALTLLLLPTVVWRWFRRGSRNRRSVELRHREQLAALARATEAAGRRS